MKRRESNFKNDFNYIVRFTYVMRCAIWYHLYSLKNVKNTHGGVLLFVKLQAKPYAFTFFKLYKWYQIVENITYRRGLRKTNNKKKSLLKTFKENF